MTPPRRKVYNIGSWIRSLPTSHSGTGSYTCTPWNLSGLESDVWCLKSISVHVHFSEGQWCPVAAVRVLSFDNSNRCQFNGLLADSGIMAGVHHISHILIRLRCLQGRKSLLKMESLKALMFTCNLKNAHSNSTELVLFFLFLPIK